MTADRTLINVCGTERSGSTMLDLMLGNDESAFSCGEVFATFRPHRRHHFRSQCACGAIPCPIWQRLRGLRAHGFHAGAMERLGVHTVIDSSKDLAWLIDCNRWAVRENIRIRNVAIYKSPIQLAYSFWKRGAPDTLWESHFMAYYSYLLQTGLPFVTVCYDEMAQSSERVFRDLCQQLDQPWFDGKERFWERTHHHQFGSPSVRRTPEDGEQALTYLSDFPDDFLAAFERNGDAVPEEVALLTAALQERDFRLFGPGVVPASTPIHRPRWYYRRRLSLAFRRFFPVSVPHEA